MTEFIRLNCNFDRAEIFIGGVPLAEWKRRQGLFKTFPTSIYGPPKSKLELVAEQMASENDTTVANIMTWRG